MLFVAEQFVAAPVATVFRFFADPNNLPRISPPESGARLLRARLVRPQVEGVPEERLRGLAGAGSAITISFRLFPFLPLRGRWTAEILEFEWEHSFRDVQVKGPFRRFDHRHEFAACTRNGVPGCMVRDRVDYEVGYGPLGRVADVFSVRRVLRRMFAYRHAATERLLAQSAGGPKSRPD